jgi:aspartyl-tRNA(Asn)/glutamyl-tRNA(Gln) amidotransferase subunit A
MMVFRDNIKSNLVDLEYIQKEYKYFNYLVSKSDLIDNGEKKSFFSVKDSICVKGMPTTAGSQILTGYTPRFNATVVERLLKAGGTCIGKTAMDAFGFGSFNVNVGLDKEIPLNPIDTKRVCGGSSGGAAGLVKKFNHIALGQSTGGSIACPASFCGVVGLTPTYGRVSRYGLLSYANSLDKIGPIAQTVTQCAQALEIISGSDGKDATCIDMPKGFVQHLGKNLNGIKIGIIKEGFGEGVNKEVAEKVREAISFLCKSEDKISGNEISGVVGSIKINAETKDKVTTKEISLPLTMKYGVPVYYLIALTEASTNLAKYCGLRYGQEGDVEGKSFNDYFSEIRSQYFNTETKRRILLGTFARMAGFRDAYYIQAAKIRAMIIAEYQQLFETYDVLISPTMPIVAPTFEDVKNLTPMQQYMMDILTVGPNLAGLPHISIPCGTDSKTGMPIGMLLIGNHWKESTILQVAHHYEKTVLRKTQ